MKNGLLLACNRMVDFSVRQYKALLRVDRTPANLVISRLSLRNTHLLTKALSNLKKASGCNEWLIN